jgi:DnaJ-class molecular chaperone
MTSNKTSKNWESGFLSDSDDEILDNVSNDIVEKDYYKILGLDKKCNYKDIKMAYRKKARELHPDKHINEQDKYKKLFQEISEAYSILKDPKKRQIYDKFGVKGVKKNNFFIPTNKNDLNMLFKMAFEDDINENDKHAYLDKPQSPPIELDISIPLDYKYLGGEIQNFAFKRKEICKCKLNSCKNCGGTGSIARFGAKTFLGLIDITRTCNICNGSGKLCSKCCNKGFFEETCTLQYPLVIKKGITNNTKQVLYKMGNQAKNFERGDVVITFKINEM